MFPDFSRAEWFAAIGIIISIIRYGIYFRAIYKGQARPHVFSWLNWGLLVGIGAFLQYMSNGGPSVWVLVCVSSVCFAIAAIATRIGEKNITRSDWIAFTIALMAIPVWLLTKNPVYSLIWIIVIDCASYYPTVRKSWRDPWGEPPGSYVWAGSRYFFAAFAVNEFTWQQMIYPLFLMMSDWAFAAYVFLRRRHLESKQ